MAMPKKFLDISAQTKKRKCAQNCADTPLTDRAERKLLSKPKAKKGSIKVKPVTQVKRACNDGEKSEDARSQEDAV